jgi:4-amino-4-deoxy-L-arabinose transferase-like glycosyltransferase
VTTDSASRRFFLEILRYIWPAYVLASVLILRGFHWSLPSAYQDKSFQADENAAVWAVNQIHFPHASPHWFPWGTGLFYQVYLMKLIFTVGGLLHATDYWMLVMGRLVVFASALGALTALFVLTRKIFDTWTAQLATCIFAALPGFVINAHYFKTDVPMTCWMLVTLVFAYRLLDTGNPRDVLWLGLLVGYTASIKYSAGLLLIVGLVTIAMARRKFHKSFSWISYLLCVGLGFAFGEPVALRPSNWKDIFTALRWVAGLNRLGVPYHVARPPAWIDYPLDVMPYSMTAPTLLAAAAAFLWVLLKRRREFLPVLVFVVIYYPLLAMDNWRLVRYTVPFLPFAALFVASLVAHLRKRPVIGSLSIAAAYAILIYAFLFSFSYVRVMAQEDPRIQATRWIQQNLPAEPPIPTVPAWDLDNAQLRMIGYPKLDVNFHAPELASATSPYLIFSEWGTSFYLQAIGYYPEKKQFFDYIDANYTELIHFENSQKLLFINSKRGSMLPQDWLHANPRITILIRRTGSQSGPNDPDSKRQKIGGAKEQSD